MISRVLLTTTIIFAYYYCVLAQFGGFVPNVPMNYGPAKIDQGANIGKGPAVQVNGTAIADIVIIQLRKEVIKSTLNNTGITPQKFEFLNINVELFDGKIQNLANLFRVGDVLLDVHLADTKIRTAIAVYNSSGETEASTQQKTYLEVYKGHVHSDVDNCTIFVVYKVDYFTQEVTIEEFEVTMGGIINNVTGFGDKTVKGTALFNAIAEKLRGPILAAYSKSYKELINSVLKTHKTAIFLAATGGAAPGGGSLPGGGSVGNTANPANVGNLASPFG